MITTYTRSLTKSVTSRSLALAALAIVATSSSVFAGPLSPPAGPVGSSFKTLGEVEPRIAINSSNTPGDADSMYKITQPGSYYLTGNVTGVTGKHGIEIAASDVTIDLGGFQVRGVAGSLHGITVSIPNQSDIVVLNGSVRGWAQHGVDLANNAPKHCTIRNIHSHDNGDRGIRVSDFGTVTDCTANNNGTIGIDTYSFCRITNCQVDNNTTNGIDSASECQISECIVRANSNGILCTLGGTIKNCIVSSNTLDGILTNSGCTILGNTCSSNGTKGIHVYGSKSRIEGNQFTLNSYGIKVENPGNLIIKNTSSGNTYTNWYIYPGNVVGPILDRQNPGNSGIDADSGSSSLGTTEPNANFTY